MSKGNFGICFLSSNDINNIVKMAKVAEDNNFQSCWIAEDYFCGGAFSIAAACAGNTSLIDICIGVINPYTRHPVLTAMELGSLDIISQGRAILGMGASNKHWIEDQMKIPFDKPLTAMYDSVRIIRGLLKDSQIDYDGKYIKTGEIDLDFEPYRKNPPIYLGVKGPKALQVAGKVADGLLLSMMTSEEYVDYALEKIKKGALAAGRDIAEIEIAAYLLIYVTENKDKVMKFIKPLIARYMGLHGLHPILTSTGLRESDIRPFREAFLNNNDVSHLVTDWMVDKFAIIGSPEECRDKLKTLKKSGINHPIVFQIPGVPIESTIEQVNKYLM